MHLTLLSRFLFTLAVATGLAVATPAQAAYLKSSACTLIDTDFDIDDMMAIPLIIGNRYVAAIITSEGYTLPAEGAGALSRLIAEPEQRSIPVIIGQTTNLSQSEIVTKWGQFVLDYRAMMNKSFALMSAPLPPSPQTRKNYVRRVVESVKRCSSVDVLIIGSFSSFIHYSPSIRSKIRNVVIMGKPLRGDTSQEPGNYSFNCEYDMAACELAFTKQLPRLKYFYVDSPRTALDSNPVGNQEFVYGPTRAMVQALEPRGLPYALKQALLGTVRDGSLGAAVDGADYWAIDCCFRAGGKSLMWDQMAALFLLYPEVFMKVGGAGGHYEPTVTPSSLRQMWTDATNKSVNYVGSPSLK